MALFESVYRFLGWWLINIDMLFLVCLLIGSLFLAFQWQKWGKKLIFFSCAGFIFFGIIPVGLWMVENLENRFPKIKEIPQDAKGIILLGGSFDPYVSLARGVTAYNAVAGNFIHFVELGKKYPSLQLVYTGTPFEVETAKKELQALEINPARLLFEGNSKNTIDNAVKTAALLAPHPHDKWVLVASAYHLPRAVGLFRKVGFNVIPYPADYHTPGNYEPWFFIGLRLNLEAWHAGIWQWLGMVINYIMGRSDEIYPRPSSSSQERL